MEQRSQLLQLHLSKRGTLGLSHGLILNTQPIYIANGPLSPYHTPVLSTQGTSNKSFDLIPFYYGCLTATETQQAQGAMSCNLSISEVKASTEAAVALVTLKFTTFGVGGVPKGR